MGHLKRLCSFVLFAALCFSCFPISVCAEEEEEIIFHGIGYVTMPLQCLYHEPSSESEVLAVTCDNDCVIVVSDQEDSWYKVIYNLQEGYMYAPILDVKTEAHAELGINGSWLCPQAESGCLSN